MMYWYGSGMGAWGIVLMIISMILFWGVLIVIVVALLRYFGRDRQQEAGSVHPPAPERLLAERFARGEINDEEYQQRLAALQGTGHTAAPDSGKVRPPAGTSAR